MQRYGPPARRDDRRRLDMWTGVSTIVDIRRVSASAARTCSLRGAPAARVTSRPRASSTSVVGVRRMPRRRTSSRWCSASISTCVTPGHDLRDVGQDPPGGPARRAERGGELQQRGPLPQRLADLGDQGGAGRGLDSARPPGVSAGVSTPLDRRAGSRLRPTAAADLVGAAEPAVGGGAPQADGEGQHDGSDEDPGPVVMVTATPWTARLVPPGARASAAPGRAQAAYLLAQPRDLGLELQHHRDAGEVEAVGEQVADPAQPVDVVAAVEPGAAGRPVRGDEAAGARRRGGSGPWSRPSRRPPRWRRPRPAVRSSHLLPVDHGRSGLEPDGFTRYIKPVTQRYRSPTRRPASFGRRSMLLRTTDPFRDFDRLTQQLFGTTNRPAVMPMDAWREGDTLRHRVRPARRRAGHDRPRRRAQRAHRPRRARGRATATGRCSPSERPRGVFSRQLVLGDNLDLDRIEAALRRRRAAPARPGRREGQAAQDRGRPASTRDRTAIEA